MWLEPYLCGCSLKSRFLCLHEQLLQQTLIRDPPRAVRSARIARFSQDPFPIPGFIRVLIRPSCEIGCDEALPRVKMRTARWWTTRVRYLIYSLQIAHLWLQRRFWRRLRPYSKHKQFTKITQSSYRKSVKQCYQNCMFHELVLPITCHGTPELCRSSRTLPANQPIILGFTHGLFRTHTGFEAIVTNFYGYCWSVSNSS